MFQGFGGAGAQSGVLAVRVGDVVSGFGIDRCFHAFKNNCWFGNAGSEEVSPPASRLLWFEKLDYILLGSGFSFVQRLGP